MRIRDRISNGIYSFMEKRGMIEDIYNRSSNFNRRLVTDDSILESSDVYELVQDISN